MPQVLTCRVWKVQSLRRRPTMNARGEVLLVDDDSSFRLVLGEVLKAEGYSIREAANGIEALETLRSHAPDLILTDLMMPLMNGWDLYAELGRDVRLSGIPVAFVSSVARMRPLGARMLRKPVEMADLLALLASIRA
jgi:CheY-like chemotaxis protein